MNCEVNWKLRYDDMCHAAAQKVFDLQVKKSISRPIIGYIAAEYPSWGEIVVFGSEDSIPANTVRISCDLNSGLTLPQIKERIKTSTESCPIIGA